MPPDEGKPETLKFSIKPINPNGMEREFVNYAMVRHGDNDFTIEFCDVNPPDDKDIQTVKDKAELEVPVKFRLVCTPSFVELFISALQDNLKKFRAKKKEDGNGL